MPPNLRIWISQNPALAMPLAKFHGEAFESPWAQNDFADYLSSSTDDVLLSMDGDTLNGFILIRTVADQSEILTMAVAKGMRRQGLGRALIMAAENAAIARGADIMFLDVAEDNPGAQALYTGLDYHRCGRRTGYYKRRGGRVAAILMQKRLA